MRREAWQTRPLRRRRRKSCRRRVPTPPDSPLLDLSDAAIKKLIRSAKMRGYVTHGQINSLSKEVNSEQIEDVLAMFSEKGVNVVETEKGERRGRGAARGGRRGAEERGGELVEVQQKARPSPRPRSRPSVRTILSACIRAKWARWKSYRAERIAIAKRIEAGREAMIAGLCESPLTFQAIIIWRDD